MAEIEKKVQEIERGGFTGDVDEDDAGNKEENSWFVLQLFHQASNVPLNLIIPMMAIVIRKPIVPIEMIFVTMVNTIHRSSFSFYWSLISYSLIFLRRENWREQRSTGNTNRRGGGGGNNPKQTSYNPNNNRYQHNPNPARNPRYADNRTSYEGRDSPLQTTTEEPTRNQRVNSGNFSQGQSSGPTSPPTAVAGRTIYPSSHRGSANRNSPAPHAGSSSSRNNSVQNTTSPPNQQAGTNKLTKKPSLRKNEEFLFSMQSILVHI